MPKLKPLKTKADAQFVHSRRRALERYGLDLSPDTYRHAINLIRRGLGQPQGRITWRLSKFVIHINEVSYIVVYDKKRHTIATFLPRDAN
jgi:hypothetical protein